ncbi:MAG: 50S ribosomal protein L37ae [Thermoproteota archaeon]
MARKKESSALGVRYGFSLRGRYIQVLKRRKAWYNCPKCGTGVLKRLSVGVWSCRKCSHTFAGGAYEPLTKTGETAARVVSSASRPRI